MMKGFPKKAWLLPCLSLALCACGGKPGASANAALAASEAKRAIATVAYAVGGDASFNGTVQSPVSAYDANHIVMPADTCASWARGGTDAEGTGYFLFAHAESPEAGMVLSLKDYHGPGTYEGKKLLKGFLAGLGDTPALRIGQHAFRPTFGDEQPMTTSTVVVNADGSGSWRFRNLFEDGSHDPIRYVTGMVSWTCEEKTP